MVDFIKLVMDGNPTLKDKERVRSKGDFDEEVYCKGARIFIRKFGGLFGMRVRPEPIALELIVQMGLATDDDSARNVIDSLKHKRVKYRTRGCYYFELTEVKTSTGNTAYRLLYSDF